MFTVHLKPGRNRSVRRHHPWVFSGAIARVEGEPGPGDIVRLVDHEGTFLAWGYFNRASQICVRVLDWNEGARIDSAWWRERLRAAIEMRRMLPELAETNACRLVHGEADGIPGLIVDRYDRHIVLQALTAGVERVKPLVVEALTELQRPAGIFERSDADARGIEGLASCVGIASGDAPPKRIHIAEGPFGFSVDIEHGHKTGFYLDQRENRQRVAPFASGRRVLDLFSYTGGFAVHALGAGAKSVTLVDSSHDALEMAEHNVEANGLDAGRVEVIEGNVFDVARFYRDEGRRFDMVIIDPPKFAQTKTQLEKAERAYKDINLVAMKILEPGGILVTFSCSGAVGAELFTRMVAWASWDAGRDIQILHRLSQAADHPVNPSFPESEYLKGLVCRVI